MDYGRQLREMKDYLVEVNFYVFLFVLLNFHCTFFTEVIFITACVIHYLSHWN